MDAIEKIEKKIAMHRAKKEAEQRKERDKWEAHDAINTTRIVTAVRNKVTELLGIGDEEFEVEVKPYGGEATIRLPGCADITIDARPSLYEDTVYVGDLTLDTVSLARSKYLRQEREREMRERTEALRKRWEAEVNDPAVAHNLAIEDAIKAQCCATRMGLRVWYSVWTGMEEVGQTPLVVAGLIAFDPEKRWCRVSYSDGREAVIFGVTRIDEQVPIDPPYGVTEVRLETAEFCTWIWPDLAHRAQEIIEEMGGWKQIESFEAWRARQEDEAKED